MGCPCLQHSILTPTSQIHLLVSSYCPSNFSQTPSLSPPAAVIALALALATTATMSEWRGSKGKPPTKPHNPSRLRNEVLADSVSDERAGEQSRVQVPDSDVIIPETQPDNGDVDATDWPDEPMSPKSYAVLSRNQIFKRGETLATSLDVQLLSRPSQDEPSAPPSNFFFKPARTVLSRSDPKSRSAPTSDVAASAVVPTSSELADVATERK